MECPTCRLPVDEIPRADAVARRPGTPSLYECPTCGRSTPGKKLPPALKHRRGKAWTTAPEAREGVALFVDGDRVRLTCWTSPFIEGPSLSLSLAALRKFLRAPE